MKGVTCLFLVFAMLVVGGAAADEPDFKIINLVPDFLRYHESCRDADQAERAAQWDAQLELPNRAFFSDVLYRGKQGEERERYKRASIDLFWRDVAPRLDRVARLNRGVEQRVRRVVDSFRTVLPDFRPSTDFYITISMGFRGKVAAVGGRPIFALGLEEIDPEGPELDITIAHELFHLYHFETFGTSGGLYRDLWAEGLATYASAVVVPKHRASAYLGFDGAKMNRCQQLLPTLAADFLEHMGENDQRLRRVYFGAEDNDTQVPPAAGYYLGLEVVQEAARSMPLDKLARLDADQVFTLVRRELDRLAATR